MQIEGIEPTFLRTYSKIIFKICVNLCYPTSIIIIQQKIINIDFLLKWFDMLNLRVDWKFEKLCVAMLFALMLSIP